MGLMGRTGLTGTGSETMSSCDDLNWQAQQYVLGEMSAEATAAFERRLADDEAACEAVVAASALVLALQVAGPDTMSPRAPISEHVSFIRAASEQRPTERRNPWMSVAALTMSLAALLCLGLVQVPTSTSTASRDAVDAAALVSLWHTGMVDDAEDVDDSEDALDPAGSVAVPGWMLAAVSIEAGTNDPVQEN